MRINETVVPGDSGSTYPVRVFKLDRFRAYIPGAHIEIDEESYRDDYGFQFRLAAQWLEDHPGYRLVGIGLAEGTFTELVLDVVIRR